MMSSANGHASEGGENSNSVAKTSSTKRKRPANSYGADVVVEPRKCRLDFDILDCPICFEHFSSPVFQCRNGHTACSSCCKKFVKKKCPQCECPIGDIRCQAIERILDSLQLSCKYAEYGCRELLKIGGDLSIHEEHCRFEPLPCPSEDCIYEGTCVSLPIHLEQRHFVHTKPMSRNANDLLEALFVMEPGSKFMLLKVPTEDNPVFLVHRELHEPLGDLFFCSALHNFSNLKYDLTVNLLANDCGQSYCMTGARVIDRRFRDREYWKHGSLLLPTQGIVASSHVVVHVSLGLTELIVNDRKDN